MNTITYHKTLYVYLMCVNSSHGLNWHSCDFHSRALNEDILSLGLLRLTQAYWLQVLSVTVSSELSLDSLSRDRAT